MVGIQYNDTLTSLTPGAFDNFPNLRILELNDNQINSLPPEMFKLDLLQELALFNNQLTTLPADFSDNIPAVTNLLLHNNKISHLPEEVFRNFSNISINLSFNRLSNLPVKLFTGMNYLTINLSNNPLISIPRGIFDGVNEYSYIDFYSTCLNTEDSELTDYLDSLGIQYL
jgi:Leucine-rich repeat (LRR) protein